MRHMSLWQRSFGRDVPEWKRIWDDISDIAFFTVLSVLLLIPWIAGIGLIVFLAVTQARVDGQWGYVVICVLLIELIVFLMLTEDRKCG